jgi:hypothetical protein
MNLFARFFRKQPPARLKMIRNPFTGVVQPQAEGDYCQHCGYLIPGSDNPSWELHLVEPGEGETVAYHRSDLLYMTWPKHDKLRSRLVGEHLLTLQSRTGYPAHVMLNLTCLLRDLARTAAGRAMMADWGVDVLSTHTYDLEVASQQQVQVLLQEAVKELTANPTDTAQRYEQAMQHESLLASQIASIMQAANVLAETSPEQAQVFAEQSVARVILQSYERDTPAAS